MAAPLNFGMGKLSHLTFYWACCYLSLLVMYVNKEGPVISSQKLYIHTLKPYTAFDLLIFSKVKGFKQWCMNYQMSMLCDIPVTEFSS